MIGVSALYVEGIFQVTNLLLSIVAFILLSLLFLRYKGKELRPFVFLMAALLLFDALVFFGALRSFGVYDPGVLTHLLPAPILILLTYAIYLEIQVREGKK